MTAGKLRIYRKHRKLLVPVIGLDTHGSKETGIIGISSK